MENQERYFIYCKEKNIEKIVEIIIVFDQHTSLNEIVSVEDQDGRKTINEFQQY